MAPFGTLVYRPEKQRVKLTADVFGIFFYKVRYFQPLPDDRPEKQQNQTQQLTCLGYFFIKRGIFSLFQTIDLKNNKIKLNS